MKTVRRGSSRWWPISIGGFGHEGLELEVRAGAEVALLSAAGLDAEELRRGYGSAAGRGCSSSLPRLPSRTSAGAGGQAARSRAIGCCSPTRSAVRRFQRDPGRLATLVGDGVLASVTASSLRGHFGEDVARFALELLRSDLVHNVASDAHHHELRPPTMLDELDLAGLAPLAEWLTSRVPRAILDGRGDPPAPPRQGELTGEHHASPA